MASSTGKGGRRKFGRGMRSPAHTRYIATGRRETNRVKKLKKHIKQQPKDKVASKALGRNV